MEIILIIIIVILVLLLIFTLRRNSAAAADKEYQTLARETALDIAGRIASTRDSGVLCKIILESSLKVIPKAKFGSILMFNSEGLLEAKASVGFNTADIHKLKLRLEDSFLYLAAGGRPTRTLIINRLENLIRSKNIVMSENGLTVKSEISSPLYNGRELVGLLCVDGDQIDLFKEEDIFILDYMARQISIVMNNQKLYEEIQQISTSDSMTNLLNRESFERDVERLLNDPSKNAGNLYYVLFDIDDLKVANDTIGHHFGDEVIRGFASHLRRYLGKNDLFARYGGDEFAAIIQGDHLQISHALEDAKKEFTESKIGLLSNDFVASFSFGMASFLESNLNLDTLYKLADGRMQEEKARRKREKEREERERTKAETSTADIFRMGRR